MTENAQMDQALQMYRELTGAFGVPGFEHDIRRVIKKRLDGLADEVTTDNLGSLIAKREGKDPSVSIAFVAHMDECGFMVKSTEEKGFIKFLPLGGWNPPVVLGQRVTVVTAKGPVHGIVGARPPHGMTDEEKKKPIRLEDLWIDCGVDENFHPGKDIPIRPGDPIVPYGKFQPTPNEKIYMARNWDNRVGCAVLLHVLEGLKTTAPPCNVYGVFAVQEEVGLRGAGTAAWKVDPDIAVALDVSLGSDTPGEHNASGAKLGGGTSIMVYDRTMVPHIGLRETVARLAKEKNIPHHFASVDTGYDTGRVHLHKDGVPSCVMGIPSRYIHGFASMVHRDDIESTAKLALALIEKTNKGLLEKLKAF